MSSNKANGVTSPTKVKELAGIFQSLEPPKTTTALSAKQQASASRRAFATGKTSIVIEDKDSKQLGLHSARATKPGSKVGEISQNYHHPHPVVKIPTTPTPRAAQVPSPGVSLQSNSKPQMITVNGTRGLQSSTPGSVRIRSWNANTAEEFQNTESVKARAARMNSQQDATEAYKPVTPTPGKLNNANIFSSPPPQQNDYEPQSNKVEEYNHTEEEYDNKADYGHREEEYDNKEDYSVRDAYQEDNYSSPAVDENTNNDYQSDYRNEEQEVEDHREDEEVEDHHEDHLSESHHQEDENEDHQGYQDDANEEHDFREDDTSSNNAEQDAVRERDDDEDDQETESNQNDYTTRAEEHREEAQDDDEADEGNIYEAEKDNEDSQSNGVEEDSQSNGIEEDSNDPSNDDNE